MLPDVFVCVKQAVAVSGALALTADELWLAPECRKFAPNEADLFAMEQALRLREQGIVGKVTCVTAGPPEAEAMLKLALAMGADRALRIHVDEHTMMDEAATGDLLGAAIAQLGGRLVLAAQRSDDGGSGIVPAALARALGAAYLSNVAAIRLSGEGVEVERKLERGNRQVWSAALPAVVAVEPGTVLVRYVSVAALIVARRRAVETVTPAEFGVDPASLTQLNQLKRLTTPRRRPKKTAAAVAVPGPMARGRSMMMGAPAASTASSKDKKILTGAAEDMATAVVNLLVEREILARPGN